MFVANVGESRVLLCKTDQDDVMSVIQHTVDHNLNNLDEVMRLTNLELKVSDGKINGLSIKMFYFGLKIKINNYFQAVELLEINPLQDVYAITWSKVPTKNMKNLVQLLKIQLLLNLIFLGVYLLICHTGKIFKF